ncbi:hypothetical protein FisN_13Lh280 [Fistulifera solaris]|uniref:Chitin-binding type-2 domain-containing protein n=1 Tax=Fistulifera solaris TaxID=1519565 RepID=A0A1Z5KLK9_FISSO|nr:hypothetical protein FisN_13Lh280 [Fistulifera solaris]|eukprot:GAX27169.1 hypothetical protein FisN_13Lh280 [Fistulifera solaris]
MLQQFSFFLLLSALVVSVQAETANNERALQDRYFDKIFPGDVCENEPGIYGPCDQSRFRQCEAGTLICYNRKPMRHTFYQDSRQPVFYINYDTIFCYPETWSGCSSCAPGRYCLSEDRCILDDINYPCTTWL